MGGEVEGEHRESTPFRDEHDRPMFTNSKLTLCMFLAPRLATFTYAAAHMIPSSAIAGSLIWPTTSLWNAARGGDMLMKAQPVVQTLPRSTSVQTALPAEGASTDLLAHQDDAWHSMKTLTHDFVDGDISDARISSGQQHDGFEWEVVSPITFSYKVRETTDVLDPQSELLIYGHAKSDEERERLKARALKRVVVVDEQVFALYAERIHAYFDAHGVDMRLMVLPTTEENKDMEMVMSIAKAIDEHGIDRRFDPVIAIGGGVCMDIVGFAASIYRRRTPYIRVPTTLMGYVDASVGAKSGVNFAGKKNKLGCYLPPALALLDRSFLVSLDARQLSNGAAEIMKMAMVKDPELFGLLEKYGAELITYKFQDFPSELGGATVPTRVLHLAIQTMLEELAPNLWEDSLTRLVDFGHIFSLELEMDSLFEEKLFHGEAVAIDMAFSVVLAHVRGHIDLDTCTRLLGAMRSLQLPVFHELMDSKMCAKAMYERVKFSQGQKLPLPVAYGTSRIFNDVSQEQMEEALSLWHQLCK